MTKTNDDFDQMADEEKFERTIAILGRLLRDDLQLQVLIWLIWGLWFKSDKQKLDAWTLFSAGSLPYAGHDDPLPEGAIWSSGTTKPENQWMIKFPHSFNDATSV